MNKSDKTIRVIAIDGPAGSGKSTVARALARELNLEVLDTGAMYRAVALVALEEKAILDDPDQCALIALDMDLNFDSGVCLGKRDISAEIRGPEVTAAVSKVAALPPVRVALVQRQREWVEERGGGIVEGRDIGTVVFPNATLKIFLTARHGERARRRQGDEAAAARAVAVESVAQDLARRDEIDSTRSVSPLAQAADALVIDTSDRNVDEVVAEILNEYRGRK